MIKKKGDSTISFSPTTEVIVCQVDNSILTMTSQSGPQLRAISESLATKPTTPRTYRKTKRPPIPRTWRTRIDPFEDVWGQVQLQLSLNPNRTAKDLLLELQQRYPGMFPDRQCARCRDGCSSGVTRICTRRIPLTAEPLPAL